MSSEKDLKEKVQQLEAELARYRGELARANDEIEKIIRDLANELKIASSIQKLLTPTQLASIQGVEFSTKFIPGTEFGGDYFDIFEMEDKMRFGVVVASSSGYGMSALFLSVLLKLASKIEAKKGMDPDLVLQGMIKELLPNMNDKDFASVFYAVVDRRTFEMKYSLAGGICVWTQSCDQEHLTKLEASTPPFNKTYSAKPLTHSINLNGKDRIIICTDGIVGAKNPNNEAFGLEKVQKAVSKMNKSNVHEIRNEILYQAQIFSGLDEPLRDQTVLVVEVKDRVIKLAKSK